jgi:hypothetical protein
MDNEYTIRVVNSMHKVFLGSQTEVLELLDVLKTVIVKRGVASVSDLTSLIGITGTYLDVRQGWTDLSEVTVEKVMNGFVITFPESESI